MKVSTFAEGHFKNISYDEAGCVLIPDLTSDDVISFRSSLKLTQEEFASKFQIPLATLRNWEQNRSKPLISSIRLEFFNKLFDEKAKVIEHLDAREVKQAA